MNTPTQAIEDAKKTYTPPRLVVYGNVRLLTQGGATGGNETNPKQTSKPKPASDRMMKENIVAIGAHPLGFGVYLFDYKPEHRERWGYGRQFGVMAQEVEGIMPEAVLVHPDGHKIVDYAMLGISQGLS